MMKIKRNKMITAAVILTAGILFLALYANGPENINQAKIDSSPNFIGGKAKNYTKTPLMTGKSGMFSGFLELLSSEGKPEKPVPSVKTDLHGLDKEKDIMVWLGHSSIMVQTNGRRILTDPLLTEAGSPVPFINKPFEGTKIYGPEDIPDIDYLIITHDHYDHLSKKTVKAIKDNVKTVICPLGVGKYLKSWGYPEEKITEMDWGEKYAPEEGFVIHCLPARHFSGRGLFSRNTTLWAAFLFETPVRKIYFGGDSGYGKHFKETGERFGGVDLAFLENGQYDGRWKLIHMNPEETLNAARDIKAEFIMPVHNSKFKLAPHQWNEPLKKITGLHDGSGGFTLMTPLIGEAVPLWDKNREVRKWWED